MTFSKFNLMGISELREWALKAEKALIFYNDMENNEFKQDCNGECSISKVCLDDGETARKVLNKINNLLED